MKQIGAIVLAAGLSRRMGQPKMVLPWGDGTVVEQVVKTLQFAGAADLVVVTGGAHDAVEKALAGQAVKIAYNPRYDNGEMLASLQVGLREANPEWDAFLLALGDQPQMRVEVVRQVMDAYQESAARLVVPSYQMRRGHPWLVGRELWEELLAYQAPLTMRDFLNRHKAEIHYVNVGTDSILMDLDTPEDYRRQSPSGPPDH